MELRPRYGPDPILTMDGSPSAIAEPVIRQRRRLAESLAGLDEDGWTHPSRCAGWSSREVIVHLDSTNAFWTFSIVSGLGGAPTEMLASFDPVASPAELVAASSASSADVLASFVGSTEALIEQIEALDDEQFTLPAEAPPGHISVSAVLHHALWDSWIHERDVLLPLGHTPDEEPDEIVAALRYAAALNAGLSVSLGRDQQGSMSVAATDPDVTFTVDVADHVALRSGGSEEKDFELAGPSVHLLEALSQREPLEADVPPESAWLVGGLAEVFQPDPSTP